MTYKMSSEERYSPIDGAISGIEKVSAILEEISKECVDIEVDRKQFSFGFRKHDPQKSDADVLTLRTLRGEYDMNYLPIVQYCNLLKGALKGNYVYQCLMYNMGERAQDNISAWELQKGDPLFVRVYQDGVRAILTSRYTAYDNKDCVDLVNNVLLDVAQGQFIITDYEITEYGMKIQLSEAINMFNKFKFGFVLVNSECGTSGINIYVTIRCERGNIKVKNQNAKLMNQKHVGDMTELKKNVEAYFGQIKQLRYNVEDAMSKGSGVQIDLVEEIGKIKDMYKLSKEQDEKLQNMFIYKKPKNKLEVAELIAEMSVLFPSLKDEFEGLAGDYLFGDASPKGAKSK